MTTQATAFDELLQKGIEQIQNGDFAGAEKTGTELTRLDPDSADGFHLAAIALQHQYRWADSIRRIDQAIVNAPYSAALFNMRGFAWMSLNEFSKAEADFNEAVSLEDLEGAHRNLVLLRIVQDRSTEAIELLTERIKKNPANADNLEMMADLMERSGYTDKARSWRDAADEARAKK